MDDLAYSLKTMAARVADGSHATRANRHRGLQAMAGELKALGYRLPGTDRPEERSSHCPAKLFLIVRR